MGATEHAPEEPLEGNLEVQNEEKPREIEATVWRIGPDGVLITSAVARHAAWFAQQEPNAIYFYADLVNPDQVTHSEETMQKVHKALANVGLTEGQVIKAINSMQSAGIFFRESAI